MNIFVGVKIARLELVVTTVLTSTVMLELKIEGKQVTPKRQKLQTSQKSVKDSNQSKSYKFLITIHRFLC